jgi:hypothetical protein
MVETDRHSAAVRMNVVPMSAALPVEDKAVADQRVGDAAGGE